jgi:hypothetical protein
MSTTAVSATALNNIFPDITGDQNAASQVDYKCIFLMNNHATISLQNAVLWIVTNSTAATIALGIDTTAASAIASGTAQALTIANTTTAPAGVTFASPSSKAGSTLAFTTPLLAQTCQAIWLRRTATNSAATNNDTVSLQIQGDTTA